MKNTYSAPQLTVVAINVERGYAGSTLDFSVKLTESGSKKLNEDRTASSNWTLSNDENFWGENGYGSDLDL